MPFMPKPVIAMLLMSAVLRPSDVGAQAVLPDSNGQGAGVTMPANVAPELTGKERLGEKWKDEQRIDNCKVPLDKRGTKPRPDGCAHSPTE